MRAFYLPPRLELPAAVRRERAHARILSLVDERGGSITAADLCDEMTRRGWAEPDVTPESIGLDPADIIERCRHE